MHLSAISPLHSFVSFRLSRFSDVGSALEPGTLALLALGGVAVLAKRRRK